jgi:hypothetical protein
MEKRAMLMQMHENAYASSICYTLLYPSSPPPLRGVRKERGQFGIEINTLVFVYSGNITKTNETGASPLRLRALFNRLEDG